MDEFAYDSIGVLTETESTFNENLLEVLNQLYADRVAMSISMEATIIRSPDPGSGIPVTP